MLFSSHSVGGLFQLVTAVSKEGGKASSTGLSVFGVHYAVSQEAWVLGL